MVFATPKHPVLQYDGDNAAEVLAAASSPFYWYERLMDGNLALIDWWNNQTIVTPEMYVCNGRIFADEAALLAEYYILPETP